MDLSRPRDQLGRFSDWRRVAVREIRSIQVILSGDADEREQGISPGIG
jgi:hypothetical protein